MVKTLVGLGAAAGVTCAAEAIEKQPEAELYVLHVDRHITSAQLVSIRRAWERLWKGVPPTPLIVLPHGTQIEKVAK
jgi:hypothetical protein